MDMCPTSFSKRKGHMGGEKKKKEEETNVKMWGTTSAKVGMAGETKGSGWHGVKVATWHGQWGRVG